MQRDALEASRETTVKGFAAALFAPPKEIAPVNRIGSREIRDGRPRTPKWSAERGRLKNYIGPAIGKRPIADVVGDEVWKIVDKVLRAGQSDFAERLKVDCNRIWRAAVLAKKCAHNLVADLPVVRVPKSKHRPAILIPQRYGDLLRAIDGYTCRTEVSTRYLPKILPHLALRSAAIRWPLWSMINLEAAEL